MSSDILQKACESILSEESNSDEDCREAKSEQDRKRQAEDNETLVKEMVELEREKMLQSLMKETSKINAESLARKEAVRMKYRSLREKAEKEFDGKRAILQSALKKRLEELEEKQKSWVESMMEKEEKELLKLDERASANIASVKIKINLKLEKLEKKLLNSFKKKSVKRFKKCE